ncbi:MAG: flagellar motor protein MotB [Clostridiaceae bacterium]|jgi:chemotaxis protein MotB|nr:flagellar motor protein MotB [Clostridiaceae bacterium]
MAKKNETEEVGAPAWMATYGDLVTNLLVFFVLLYSMSTVDQNTFSEVAASLSYSMINLKSGDSVLDGSNNSIIAFDYTKYDSEEAEAKRKEKYIEDANEMIVNAEQKLEAKELDEAKNDIRDTIAEQGISDKVQVVEEKDFLLIRLDQEIFFDSGSADILPEGKTVLSSIAVSLRDIGNEIMISGHTDNVPMTNKRYATNWELSTARATNVVRYFVEVENLEPSLFTATGNGEYRPVGDNNTPEGRQQNRRIEIKILK